MKRLGPRAKVVAAKVAKVMSHLKRAHPEGVQPLNPGFSAMQAAASGAKAKAVERTQPRSER